MTGIFHAVGVGPGDPELVTLKAKRILNRVAVVVAPESAPGKGSIAAEIARVHLDDPGKIMPLVFPMTYDRDALDAAWQANLDAVLAPLAAGRDVAFVTLGDPMLYSTCAHLMRHLEPRGVRIETVPGVPALCAAAGRLNRPLAGEDQTLVIVPGARHPKLDALLALADNVAVMKPSRGYAALVEKLDEHGFLENAVMVSHCGRAGERVVGGLRAVDSEPVDYLSIILAGKRGAA